MITGVTPATLAVLAAHVEDRAGLHYGVLDREILAEKAGARALEAGFESLLDYYYYLRYDPQGDAELERLVEALVVGETYFFRELAPVSLVADQLVPALLRQGSRPRIWSAACATGEEPLTLAMLLDARGLLDAVDLVASDISARALARAAAGRYGTRSIRDGAPPELVERYLRKEPDGGYTVSRRLVAAVDWRRLNLLERERLAGVGRVDVVLCRNVLIYFAEGTVARVVNNLASALRPGGALLVGVSESLLRFGTTLDCEEHGNVFLYRKPA
jgi:chemotaxis protein methyltransferase CheR